MDDRSRRSLGRWTIKTLLPTSYFPRPYRFPESPERYLPRDRPDASGQVRPEVLPRWVVRRVTTLIVT